MVAVLVAGLLVAGSGNPGAASAVMVLGLIVVIGAAAVVAIVIRRFASLRGSAGGSSRRLNAEHAAARLGLSYQKRGPAALVREFSRLGVVAGRATIKHLMTGQVGERGLVAFESVYTVYTGQAVIPIMNVVYASEAPGWPRLRVGRRSVLGRVLRSLVRRPGLLMDLPEFNRFFSVTAHDEDFALLLLSPEMQSFMLERPDLRWVVGDHRVSLVYRGTLKPDRIERSVQRLERFWSLVPDELLAWDGESSVA